MKWTAVSRRSSMAACLAAQLALSACGTADHYGSRAILLNKETANARSELILLNVIRAAHREPLQFTDTSTITGTASVGASIGSALPVAGTRGTGASLFSLMPGATVSEGPAFNVVNLDTQEFYEGLQTPVSLDILAQYYGAHKDMSRILALTISDIELRSKTSRTVIHNDFDKPGSHQFFRSIIEEMLRQGLALDQVDSDQAIGPTLDAAQASDPQLLSGLARAYGQATAATAVPHLDGKKAMDGTVSKSSFDLVKKSKQTRFCFDGKLIHDYKLVSASVIAASSKTTLIRHLAFDNGPIPSFDVQLPPGRICGSGAGAKAESDGRHEAGENLMIKTRSVEQILYYLGDMTRARLGLDGTPARDVTVLDRSGTASRLFDVHASAGTPEDVSVGYHGRTYAVGAGDGVREDSLEVLQFLNDLIALESSAKSYPAPNIISVSAP